MYKNKKFSIKPRGIFISPPSPDVFVYIEEKAFELDLTSMVFVCPLNYARFFRRLSPTKAKFEGSLICARDLEQMALPMCRKFSLRAIKGYGEVITKKKTCYDHFKMAFHEIEIGC